MNPTGGSDLSGLRILVVEDEMMLAMLIGDWLAMLDCKAVKAARLEQAVALADSEDLDGALLDVNLGGSGAIRSPRHSIGAKSPSFS